MVVSCWIFILTSSVIVVMVQSLTGAMDRFVTSAQHAASPSETLQCDAVQVLGVPRFGKNDRTSPISPGRRGEVQLEWRHQQAVVLHI